MDKDFQIGDLVMRPHSHRKMVVERVAGTIGDPLVTCLWDDGKDFHTEIVPGKDLILANDQPERVDQIER